jgi:hypothetical protein
MEETEVTVLEYSCSIVIFWPFAGMGYCFKFLSLAIYINVTFILSY